MQNNKKKTFYVIVGYRYLESCWQHVPQFVPFVNNVLVDKPATCEISHLSQFSLAVP